MVDDGPYRFSGAGSPGCKFAGWFVRTCAPCRQYPFERPAGGLLQVPERLKKNLSFTWHRNSSSYPNVRKSLAEAGRRTGGPEKGVQNHWFWRVFAYFCRAAKVGAGSGAAQAPGYRIETMKSNCPKDPSFSRLRRLNDRSGGLPAACAAKIRKGAETMRVITGTARGRRLKELEGYETRPTTDRVKEGIFNIIQFDIEGRKVLDLYAGTGQLGIEALSRGAAGAVFVDQRRDAASLIRDNLKLTGLEDRSRVVCGDAAAFLSSAGEKFGLIFIDPPYAANLWENTIKAISQFDILSNHGIIVCESPADQDMPPVAPPYFLRRTYRYGRVKITTYFREEAAQG